MSEFADSIHFLGKDVPEVEELMRQVRAQGLILGSNGRTVSVLVGWDHKPQLSTYGNVIDYAYGEDHGIWIKFYKDGEMVAKIVITWGTQRSEETERENRAGITDDLATILVDTGFLDAERALELAARLSTFDPKDWQSQDAFVDAVGNILGLCGFRWVEADDIAEILAADDEYREAMLEDLREEYPAVTLVE